MPWRPNTGGPASERDSRTRAGTGLAPAPVTLTPSESTSRVRPVNDSAIEAIAIKATAKPVAPPEQAVADALLDELDATIHQLGRLAAARKSTQSSCELSLRQSLLLLKLEESGPIRMSDAAAHLGVKAPACSALIDSLVDQGFVEREGDPKDRRVTLIRPTPNGLAAMARAKARRRETLRRYTAELSDADIRTLIRIQRTLIDRISSDTV